LKEKIPKIRRNQKERKRRSSIHQKNDIEVDGKIEVPKIDKREVKEDLKYSVLDVDKSKVNILQSISKTK
jgi:hypothetical protein